MREGSLEAPTRYPLDWKNEDFWNPEALEREPERVLEICHGCRRCVSLCQAFPQRFDLVDNSPSTEHAGHQHRALLGPRRPQCVKKSSYAFAREIAKPVETRVASAEPDHFTSDCVMAGAHIAHGLGHRRQAEHPITLIRRAYGI